MGVGNIFVATTVAPVVVLCASVSLNLLTIGLEKLAKCERSPWVYQSSLILVHHMWHDVAWLFCCLCFPLVCGCGRFLSAALPNAVYS